MPRAPRDAGLPPRYLTDCLLLLLAERPAHGYRLRSQVEAFGLDTDSGTVYRRLRDLEDDGLVGSYWEVSDAGPPRRTYEVTADGRDRLVTCRQSISVLRSRLDDFLERSQIVLATAPAELSGQGDVGLNAGRDGS